MSAGIPVSVYLVDLLIMSIRSQTAAEFRGDELQAAKSSADVDHYKSILIELLGGIR